MPHRSAATLTVIIWAQGERKTLATWQAFIDYNYRLQASVKAGNSLFAAAQYRMLLSIVDVARSISERRKRTASSSQRNHK